MLHKPTSVADNPYKSAKWDELTTGRSFNESDAPALELLCQWYQVMQQCIDDISVGDGVQVSYVNQMQDVKAMPQLATLKQASAEIRALNKQLGINDEAKTVKTTEKASILSLVIDDRKTKAEKAKHATT